MPKVFDNHMVAHVWAQGRQESGRSHNGNFYFEGANLYSYGSHYVVGIRMADGRALLNADSNSISTNRQRSYAASAVRGQSASIPDLTRLAFILDGLAYAGASPEADRARVAGRVAAFLTGDAAPKIAPRYGNANAPKGDVSVTAAAWAFELAGLDSKAAAKAAAKALKARARNVMAWAKAEAARDTADAKARARALATVQTDSAFAADLASYTPTAETFHNLARHLDQWAGEAKEYNRAARVAKAAGWPRMAETLKAREKAIRAALKVWPDVALRHGHKAALRDAIQAMKAARDTAARPFAELAAEEATGVWNGPNYVIREGLRQAEALGLFDDCPRMGRIEGGDRVARIMGLRRGNALQPARDGAAMRAKAQAESLLSRLKRAAKAEETRGQIVALRAFRDAMAGGSPVPREIAESAYRAAAALRNQSRNPFRAAGWKTADFETVRNTADAELAKAKARAAAELRAAGAAWEAERAEAWRANAPAPERPASLPRAYQAARLSDADGGALLRVRGLVRNAAGEIERGELETSWGATVPLTHAIRAFRFLALCRAKGQEWRANGRSLPVGHFRVDHVRADGGFKAGCHAFNWPEVARLAEALGLADLAPENTTEPTEGGY